MNKKTFTLALLFLCVTLVWLGVNLYWDYVGRVDVYNTFIALLFVVFACGHGLERIPQEAPPAPR